MKTFVRVAFVIASAGCSAEVMVGPDGGGADAGPSGPVTLAFTSPAAGAHVTRGDLGTDGFLVAEVPVALAIGGAPARVVITRDQRVLATVGADGTAALELGERGAAALVAIAYDGDDRPVASAEVGIVVDDPAVASCHDWLELYGVDYTTGPDSPGVAEPVTATIPINGVAWRYVENENPRSTLFGDCDLIRSLAEAAPYLRRRGVVEVADIGVYNYRCIGGGTPPNCPNGISQHAYANAIDIAGVTYDGGATYASVLTDWVIDPDAQPTCSAATEPGKDTLLHELICELKAAGVWNIVLTPNYNGDHRNHFHVDLTPGGNTINREVGVDPRSDDGAPARHYH
ncbi:MAG: extensin family protein [Kofleriaceae bacterium]